MSMSLNAEIFMECQCHGRQKPAFICQHLLDGELQGFFQPDETLVSDESWEQAWCGACEAVRQGAGGWNDESEAFAAVKLVCHDCFHAARARTMKHQKQKKHLGAWLSDFFGVRT
jgi:hypothetical protein